MKINENRNEEASHIPSGFSSNRFLTVILFTRYNVSSDAPKDIIRSSTNTSLVLI